MEANRKTLTLSTNLNLSYLRWGAGEPVILLHGLADHGLVWQSLAQTLADRYLCIAPDLRGHGESSKPAETEYDSRMLATDLEILAQNLGLQQVHVVAHSWSAKIALIWACKQPQRLRTLTLVDPFFVNRLPSLFRPLFPILYRILPFLKVMGPFSNYEAAVSLARSLKQYRQWSNLQASVFQAGIEQKTDGSWGSKFAIAARNGVFLDAIQLAGLTETITTETCLLVPKQGLNRSSLQLSPYKKYIPNLHISAIPGNHWAHLVEPQAFNQAVATFLDRHSG